MKKGFFSICAALLGIFPYSVFADDPVTVPITVSNLSFWQSKQTQKVTVNYDLASDGEAAFVTMDVLTNGVSIGLDKIQTVSGDISTGFTNSITPGTGKAIVWDARKDWRPHLSTNAAVAITAYYTNQLQNIPDIYMVVDLSGGPTATRYPVNYTLEAPNPLTDISCASNHLWLRRIEAGTFMMGTPAAELGRNSAREVQRSVVLTKSFFAGVFEVTREQYKLVMGTDPSSANSAVSSTLCPVNMVTYDEIRGLSWTNVTGITVYDWLKTREVSQTSFMGRLRTKTGVDGFDLPTDAQWEYACRAGTTGAWNDGGTITNTTADLQLDALGWNSHNAKEQRSSVMGTDTGTESHGHLVGLLKPNAYGLYDMHGNVWEWCVEWFQDATAGGTDPVGATTANDKHPRRGGAWTDGPVGNRQGFRHGIVSGSRGNSIGFRVFLTLD